MKSNSETGHAKNVVLFERLISDVNTFGTAYNPSKEIIKLTALQALHTSAKAAITATNLAESVYKNAVDEREATFSPLGKTVTSAYNILKSSDSTIQSDETVKTIYRKLQGKRAGTKLTDAEIETLKAEGKTVTQNSISQMGYDNRLANFDRFITMLSSIPAYNPNEEEFKVNGLRTYYNELATKNTNVMSTDSVLESARSNRNHVLYAPSTGLLDIASDVKSYVKGIFGSTSPQYKQISKLRFKTL
ncbi:MAG: hypothetical protein H6Q14_555 [Bacteroidetes bacterium]|nr:hypothetical protein [Bacteroidota bacterium]